MENKISQFKKLKQGAKVVFKNHALEHDKITNKKNTVETDRPISEIFNNQLRTLLGHAILFAGLDFDKIGESEMKSRKVVDMPDFKNFHIIGFSITGDDEDSKIAIDMKIESDKGHNSNINGITIPLHDDSYEYLLYLAQDVDEILEQTKSYLDGNNYEGTLFDPALKKTEKAIKEKTKITDELSEM